MRVLVTGSAGFIGYHVARRLLAEGHQVTGLDALTPYYDVKLKARRHEMLGASRGFTPLLGRLEDDAVMTAAFAGEPELVIHLAAQAGVRHSLSYPREYTAANVEGTLALLEAARRSRVRHLMIASSSSVYGMSSGASRETDDTDRPASLYAATKKATEVISHSYAHLFGLPVTCLRFFTVYGPWGRPDMALFRFAEAIAEDRPIDLYGGGEMRRDFTYIDDVVDALMRLSPITPELGKAVGRGDTLSPVAPWRVVNIAGGRPVELMAFVAAIEAAMGRVADRRMLAMQPGDVVETAADTSLLQALIGIVPATTVGEGVRAFVEWFGGWRRGL